MARDSPIITGYYRYTDIWFEWSKALSNSEDVQPLKAILAHDSVVHPHHPLHVNNVDGVQLYLGTFPTGESRLLFSSAQVDYIRYWLQMMGLTGDTIPLPYSDCLLTASDLRHVTTVVYKDGFSLRNAVKKIDKNNKRLRGANPTLTFRRELFERVRNFWREHKGVWCALDFEAWELDHTVVTEFGWRLVRWMDGQQVQEAGHLIVDEHQKYRNSRYVPDHRYDYGFGQSSIVKKTVFKKMICDLVEQLAAYGPAFLVFHDNNQDIKYLKSPSIGAKLEGLEFTLPTNIPDNGLYVVDTSDLFAALEGMQSADRRALGRVCNLMQVPTTQYLHNAGNDAHYTLEIMMLMASGDPVDIQRENRWPNQTGVGVKVEFEENSGSSETEQSDYD